MADNPSTAAVPAEAPAPPARRPTRPQPRLPLAIGPATNPSTAAAAAEALQQVDLTPAGPTAAPGAPPSPQQALRQLNQTTMAMALRHHLAGRLRQAEPLYRAILRRTPRHTAALINLSALLRVSGRLPEAREIAERSVASNPNDPMTYFGLGAALRQLRRDRESIAAYEKAVELDPTLVKAWINLAVSTERLDRARSLEAQAKVLAVEPENLVALNLQLKFHLQDCDFNACEAVLKTLIKVFQRELASVTEWRILANMAYRALFVPVPVPLQRRITDRIDQLHLRSLTEFGRLAPLPPPDPSAAGRKIRLAYMTPNFADHPVGHVTLSLFPAHDRERFEVHAIATHGRRGGDPDYNKRHRHGVDYYHDLSDLPHFEMARRIRNLGIDILVDLDGYMETTSTAIMVFRPCPVQIYWMGHAGGLGLSFVDYLLADRIIVPPGEEPLYKEQIVRMPECYHVASPSPIAEATPSRAECGLPEDAFVFSAFNNPEKFNRTAFDAWMRILAGVPGSVLWVSKVKGVPSHRQMLRRQAKERGIDPKRLVFADRLPDKAEHFARHRHIGLFLDTLTLNASTTALDALWAGVPLLTVKGDRFSNRISNSMLHWIGLDDMVMPDIESYVERAIHLARHPEDLAAIRERLQANRDTQPLFQTRRFARHLEQAYLAIWERHCRGEPPAAFDLPALPPEMESAEPAPRTHGLQLHLNGTEPREGWKIVAAAAGPEVDVVCDPRSLSAFADDSVDAIYAGWFYQRLSYRDELPQALAAAHRVLKPGGTLRIAVPDFELLCNLMINPSIPRNELFSIMALVYGDQATPDRFNRTGFTADFIGAFLKQAGFKTARRVPSFGLFNDMSSAKRFSQSIALNVLATK
ncbi:MAG TPA: tetratricopeptide repeat protein [Dongiaceae bacterium]|nr:tetratricopeptide repeat protein [Dongiaceae bacterium]